MSRKIHGLVSLNPVPETTLRIRKVWIRRRAGAFSRERLPASPPPPAYGSFNQGIEVIVKLPICNMVITLRLGAPRYVAVMYLLHQTRRVRCCAMLGCVLALTGCAVYSPLPLDKHATLKENIDQLDNAGERLPLRLDVPLLRAESVSELCDEFDPAAVVLPAKLGAAATMSRAAVAYTVDSLTMRCSILVTA